MDSLFCLPAGIVLDVGHRSVDPEENDDQLAPHSPADIAYDKEDEAADDAAAAQYAHHAGAAIIPSATEDLHKGGERDQDSHDYVHYLDHL